MDLSTLANIATALTVITAVIFGLIEARRLRRDREERAALEAVHAMLTPPFMEFFLLIQTTLPENASPAEVRSNPDTLKAVRSLGMVIEGLGYSVFERIVPLRIVDNLVGGNIRVVWRKLRRYVELERERSGSQNMIAWFQWLAGRSEQCKCGQTS